MLLLLPFFASAQTTISPAEAEESFNYQKVAIVWMFNRCGIELHAVGKNLDGRAHQELINACVANLMKETSKAVALPEIKGKLKQQNCTDETIALLELDFSMIGLFIANFLYLHYDEIQKEQSNNFGLFDLHLI